MGYPIVSKVAITIVLRAMSIAAGFIIKPHLSFSFTAAKPSLNEHTLSYCGAMMDVALLDQQSHSYPHVPRWLSFSERVCIPPLCNLAAGFIN